MTTPTVTVRGEATLEGPPDLATLSVTAQARAASGDTLRAELAQQASRVQQLLAEFDAAIKESSTGGFHLAPVFDRRGEPKVGHFTGSITTTVILGDFTALSPIVIGLGEVPQSQVSGPHWSLRRDNRLYAEARLSAITDAIGRADDYAGAVGATVADLLEISDLEPGPQTFGRPMATRMMANDDEPPEFDFEPPSQTVTAQITLRCTITPPDLAQARTPTS